MKNCKKCNIEKPLEAFNKDSKNKDGLWLFVKNVDMVINLTNLF